MIEVVNLTKKYGSLRAVDGVSFTIPAGRITGFLGPNGAGKSTTMRVITGFTPASVGKVRVAGFDVARQPLEVKRRIGYLPEHVPLYEEMTVRGFLGFVAGIKEIPRGNRQTEIDGVMERCGLTAMANRIIGNLSKGYRQRVGLAQALLGNPPVLILDEPTVGLDPRQIAEVRTMVRALGGKHTILLSTHILPEVSMVCDSVIIIHRGRVVYDGPVPDAGRGGASLEELFMCAVAADTADHAASGSDGEGIG